VKTSSICCVLWISAFIALSSGSAWAADPAADTRIAIEKAESARQKAAQSGGEWLDTGKLIDQAQIAAQQGDFVAAQSLANQAVQQGELGYQQAVQQKNVNFPSYFR
jgi:hypothetical protein